MLNIPRVSDKNSSTRELLTGLCWFYYYFDFEQIKHINLVSFFNFGLVFLTMGKLRTVTIVSLYKYSFYASLHRYLIDFLYTFSSRSSLLTWG